MITEDANRKSDTLVQVDNTGHSQRSAEECFTFTKGISEFSVVAVKQQVGLDCEALLCQAIWGAKADERQDGDRRNTSSPHLRYTISHLPRGISALTAAAFVLLALSSRAEAQDRQPQTVEDPFARGRWHAEFEAQAVLEAWNYNTSHEEIYGLVQGVTYGLRDGLVLTARQRLYYLSQRLNDSRVLGLTAGLRTRVYRRRRISGFLQFDFGVSDAAIATPPRGTRFNYLALGGGGVVVSLRPKVHLIATLELMHISNANLKGPDRNPDIEAIGPSLGLVIAIR